MADTSNSVLFDAPGPKGRRTIRIVNWIAGILFAVVLVLILMRLHNPPDGENQLSWELWKPAVEREAWTDFYLPGLWMTIKATIVAVVGAVVFGLVFGVGRLLPNPLVRGVSAVIVEFCRAVPVLLLMIFFWRWFAFAGLPSPSYWAVVLALVLYNPSHWRRSPPATRPMSTRLLWPRRSKSCRLVVRRANTMCITVAPTPRFATGGAPATNRDMTPPSPSHRLTRRPANSRRSASPKTSQRPDGQLNRR